MRLDGAVARGKFAREVARVDAQRAVLRGRGCFIVRATYPYVEALFVPPKPMRLAFSIDPDRAKGRARQARRAPKVVPVDMPMFIPRPFGVRVDLTDFDQRAPGVSFHDPFTWEPLPFAQLPPGHHFDSFGTPLRVVLDVHPVTQGPFLCMRGVREYHEHPQHTGDEWALHRRYYGLFTALDTVWRTCVAQVHPSLLLKPNNRFEFQWKVEQVV